MAVAFGEFVFDPERRELRKSGVLLKVDPLQLDLLACLLANPGKLLSKQELLAEVWEGRAVADNVLSVTVAKLRKALGHKPGERELIENRYGRGYRIVPAVTVVEAPPSQSPAPPLPAAAPSSPLVGRAVSLRRLEVGLSRTLGGTGGLFLLIGEPGIGKTRLAEALEQEATAAGVHPVWGRFQPGTPPLWAFMQALRELNRDGLADAVLSALSERIASDGSVFDTATSALGHRTVDEAARALFALSSAQPAVLFLDDLQWADAMSLRLLSYLADELARWPLLIVATLRSTELAPESQRNQDLSRLLRHRHCERVELGRLRATDVDEYVSALFGSSLDAVSRSVFARSEGNPFFMIELLRPWIGRAGPLDPAQLQLSGLALDLLRQRVQALPDTARAVLAAASVLGHDFDLGLLSHLTERSHDELLEALDDSLANDTIVPSVRIAGGYAFDHELIREVLYADLSAAERCRLHHRAGVGLARRRSTGGDVANGELAHHFLSALPLGDVALAIEHARRAAADAHALAASADARTILQRALASLSFWVDPDPEVRCRLLLELSMVERVVGDRRYTEHLAQGVALAREHGFGAMLMLAGQVLSSSPGLVAHDDAYAVLEAAAEVLPVSDEWRRAVVLAHLAWTPPNCGSARKVNALLAEAERLATRSNHPAALEAVLDAKLFFSAGPETLAVAEALAAERDRAYLEHPPSTHHTRAVSTSTFRLVIAMQRGDRAALVHAVAERAAVFAKLKNIELDWHHERFLLVDRLNRGEFAGAAQELERLRERAQRLDLQAWRAVTGTDFAMFLLRTGDPSGFAARVRAGLAPGPGDSPGRRARKLRTLAAFGFTEDVRDALAAVPIAAIHDLPHDRDYLTVLCNLASASVAVASDEHCAALYALLRPLSMFYSADIAAHCDGSVLGFLGRLARALGRREDARAHFEEALTRDLAFGLQPCAAQVRFELGTLLLESPTSAARGRTLLEQTQRIAEKLGMHPLAGAAAATLAR